MRERWGIGSPSSPTSGTASASSTGGSAKGPISGHLPGLSPCLYTFLAPAPGVLLCQQSWGSQTWAGGRGALQVPDAEPHCSEGCRRDWHPLLLGRAWAASRGQQLFLPCAILNQQLWQKALVGAESAMIPKKEGWERWGVQTGLDL